MNPQDKRDHFLTIMRSNAQILIDSPGTTAAGLASGRLDALVTWSESVSDNFCSWQSSPRLKGSTKPDTESTTLPKLMGKHGSSCSGAVTVHSIIGSRYWPA
jgi:hypothetical protein